MNPTDDPDIVPLTDGGDCSSSWQWGVGHGDDAPDALVDWVWTYIDTLDTDGDPE